MNYTQYNALRQKVDNYNAAIDAIIRASFKVFTAYEMRAQLRNERSESVANAQLAKGAR